MADLSPAPRSLGFASPALGPWFQQSSGSDSDLATPLAAPDEDLSCGLTLPNSAIWLAPAGGTLSFLIATASRPKPLADLRRADGRQAFADDALILLFRLLPEVAQRLGVLAHGAPRPDSASAAVAGTATRPIIDRLAFEIPGSEVSTIAALQAILPNNGAADLNQSMAALSDDARKAAYVGLGVGSTSLTNAARPATILRRPEKDGNRLLENRSGGDLVGKLWAFDIHGRAFDAGAWAAILNHLATVPWDNLWAASASARQRTAAVDNAQTVQLVNAHEGPLDSDIATRISGNLTDLTQVGSTGHVYRAGTSPAIGFSSASDADTDTAPLARLAPLPTGPYATLGSATPFAGWTGSGTPAPLGRDFQRIAIVDIEHQVTGLKRAAGSAQASPRRRVTAHANTANPVFLPRADDVASAVAAVFQEAGATVDMIAPELDRYWGPQTAATLPTDDPFDASFDSPTPEAHTLIGSGSTTGSTATDQRIVISFPASTFPPSGWLRVYPHGRDTDTGRRFRMDGGVALCDATGGAQVLVLLPNGEAGDGTADGTEVSFDLTLSTGAGSRFYADVRVPRPAVTETPAALAVTALGSRTLFCPEQGAAISAGSNALQPGQGVFAIDDSGATPVFHAIDTASLRPADLSNSALDNIAGADDRIITQDPAFVQTPIGTYPASASGGAVSVNNGSFHSGATAQEIYDFIAHDRNGNTGVVAALSAREPWHEAWPVSQGHPGVNAAPEIHAEGVSVAGPAADALRLLMRERRASDLQDFISFVGQPFTAATAPTAAGVFTAFLETAAKGTHGEIITDAYNFAQTWDQIKSALNGVLSGLGTNVDALIDSANFDDDVAAAAMDRLHDKAKNGVRGFARAALAAISRAEDLICLHSHALDAESWDGEGSEDNIALLTAITTRLAANPALHCLLIFPESHLPSRNTKLNQVRKAAIQGAIQALQSADLSRIAIATPIAGPGRKHHMASTTLIVDDAFMVTGAAHGWRRGLVFDSAISTSLFDERLVGGRPQEIVNARRQLLGALLGIGTNFVPETAADLVAAAKRQNTGGGFGRLKPGAFPAATDTTPSAERVIWNPSPSRSHDWVAAIAGLSGDQLTEFENGTR